MGGTGIVATAQIAATGIPFLASDSVAMALATMRRIAGDDKAFDYFEGALMASREKLTHILEKVSPGVSVSFRRKIRGRSGGKIWEKDKSEWPAGEVDADRQQIQIQNSTRGIPRSSLRRTQSVQTDGGPCGS